MSNNLILGIPAAALAFAAIALVGIGGLQVVMHHRRVYRPNLIGVLFGALLCFLLIEALPAII